MNKNQFAQLNAVSTVYSVFQAPDAPSSPALDKAVRDLANRILEANQNIMVQSRNWENREDKFIKKTNNNEFCASNNWTGK